MEIFIVILIVVIMIVEHYKLKSMIEDVREDIKDIKDKLNN